MHLGNAKVCSDTVQHTTHGSSKSPANCSLTRIQDSANRYYLLVEWRPATLLSVLGDIDRL